MTPKQITRLLQCLAACVLATFHVAHAEPRTLTSNGLQRTYQVHRPATLRRDSPAALVVVLHGGFGTGASARTFYGWDAMADKHGFVVAYPDGINRAWNAGGACCGQPNRRNIDDVGFLTTLIQALVASELIDPKRVYLAGMSNGAAMAYHYACHGTFPIAAIGPIAGSLAAPCTPKRPLSVLAIHGTDDKHVPLTGGRGSKSISGVTWLPVADAIGIFRKAAQCTSAPPAQSGPLSTDAARCAGQRDVNFLTIAGAGHQWPGSSRGGIGMQLLLDAPSTALYATQALWTFFNAHPAQP